MLALKTLLAKQLFWNVLDLERYMYEIISRISMVLSMYTVQCTHKFFATINFGILIYTVETGDASCYTHRLFDCASLPINVTIYFQM